MECRADVSQRGHPDRIELEHFAERRNRTIPVLMPHRGHSFVLEFIQIVRGFGDGPVPVFSPKICFGDDRFGSVLEVTVLGFDSFVALSVMNTEPVLEIEKGKPIPDRPVSVF